MHKGHMQSDLVWSGWLLCLVVAVTEESDQKQRTPEDQIGHCDGNEHLHSGDAFAFHLCQIRFQASEKEEIVIIFEQYSQYIFVYEFKVKLRHLFAYVQV